LVSPWSDHSRPNAIRQATGLAKAGKVEAVPGFIELCAFNFHAPITLSAAETEPETEVDSRMPRDIRTMPKGLIAPLTQAALSSLRGLADGTASSMPDDHRARLLYLALIESGPEGEAITALGRERLVSDR